MALPPPPPGATAAPAQVTAVAETVQADAPAAATEGRKIPTFGPARGENAIANPAIAGIDHREVFNRFKAVLDEMGIDLAAAVEAYSATPKSSYPGNFEGRTNYSLGGVLSNVAKATAVKVRAAKGERKARVSMKEKFSQGLEIIAKNMGKSVEDLISTLGPDFGKYFAK